MLNFSLPIIGHRGASAYAPENTMASFIKAVLLGVKWIEFDVVLAKCGTPIVFHDEILERTTSGRGLVDAYTYAELRTLDAGRWFHSMYSSERIPTLHDVLNFLHGAGMSVNVEIKPMPGKDEITVERTLEVIAQSPYKNMLSLDRPLHNTFSHTGECVNDSRFATYKTMSYLGQARNNIDHSPQLLFSSFSIASLMTLRKYAPKASLGMLMEFWEPGWEEVCDQLSCVSVHVDEAIVTEQTAKRVKDKNHYLLCYTVNNPARAYALCDMGVDAVFSDCPDMIQRELAYGS